MCTPALTRWLIHPRNWCSRGPKRMMKSRCWSPSNSWLAATRVNSSLLTSVCRAQISRSATRGVGDRSRRSLPHISPDESELRVPLVSKNSEGGRNGDKDNRTRQQHQGPPGGFAREVALRANLVARQGKGIHAASRPAQPAAARSALGGSR